MQRIHAPFDETTLAEIDREVEKKGISRAQWLSSAIESYLRLLELFKGADPAETIHELEEQRISSESLWKENAQLKRAEEKARSDAEQARRKIGALEEQIATTHNELEKARTELSLLGRDLAHYKDTLKLKDQEISFLQDHMAQLAQSISQLSLRPGEEEIRKKGLVAVLEVI